MVSRHCGDLFIMYINVKSLCCTPETNIILYVSYTLKILLLKPQILLKYYLHTCTQINIFVYCISEKESLATVFQKTKTDVFRCTYTIFFQS